MAQITTEQAHNTDSAFAATHLDRNDARIQETWWTSQDEALAWARSQCKDASESGRVVECGYGTPKHDTLIGC